MTERREQHADPTPHVRPTEQFAPGEPYPDPTAPSAPHGWAEPVRDRSSSDAASPWSAVDAPGAVPPPLAGVDGPHTRPGWLTRGRDGDRDGAA